MKLFDNAIALHNVLTSAKCLGAELSKTCYVQTNHHLTHMQIATGVHETIHLFCLFLISIEFIGVTLVNTIV